MSSLSSLKIKEFLFQFTFFIIIFIVFVQGSACVQFLYEHGTLEDRRTINQVPVIRIICWLTKNKMLYQPLRYICWRIQQKYDKLTGNVNALSSMRTTHIKRECYEMDLAFDDMHGQFMA